MAVIDALPELADILRFRGVLDYYQWRGLNVVRTWPKKYTGPLTPAMLAHNGAFSDYISRVQTMDPKLLDAAKQVSANSTWTWRDFLVACAYGNTTTAP